MRQASSGVAEPFFSVIVPLHNKEPYIKSTLESAFAQKFKEYEVIVVNDGSTDCSADIVRSFNDERLRVIDQKNAGVSSARNRGASEACGRWLAFLDADDIWSEEHLLELSRLILSFPEAGLVTNSSLEISSDDQLLFDNNCAKPERKKIDYFKSASKSIGVVNSSSVAVKKALFESVGGFSPYTLGEDLEFWARVALVSDVAKSDRHTVVYRRVTGGAMDRAAPSPFGKDIEYGTLSLDNLSPSVAFLVKKLPEIASDRELHKSVVAYINARVISAMHGSFVNGRFERMKKLRQLIITPCDSVDLKWLILARLPRWLLASMFRTRVVARWFYRKVVS